MQWLIDHTAAHQMERAWKGGLRATAEQSASWMKLVEDTRQRAEAYEARVAGKTSAAISDSYPRNVKVAGDIAEIRVEGILTKKPDFWSWLLYGANTTYESIQQALALIASDVAIKRVTFFVDSPGGTVDGLFEALAAIEAFPKPMSVRSCYACSAAYSISALAGTIEATTEAAQFGSVGVAVTYFVDENVIDITSSNAPNKRPDPTTPAGKAVIVEGLDAIEEIFVEAIAKGRQTTTKDVTKNYGRGGTVLAGNAKRLGMIDTIAKPQTRVTTISGEPAPDEDETSPDGAPEEAIVQDNPSAGTPEAPQKDASAVSGGAAKASKNMTKEELRTQHPELFSAVYEEGKAAGEKAGKEAGEKDERKRVTDHLKLGAASGDLDTAHKAIESGASMADKQADYLAASMKRGAVAVRQEETDAAGAAADGAKPKPVVTKDEQDEVAAELERLMGPPKAKPGAAA